MESTQHTQCRLQVYESRGFSILTCCKFRTDHSILLYIYQKKITEADQAVLVQLNGRIKWVNEKGEGKYSLQNLSKCSTSLNQEANYLLHRQLTKAEKKKYGQSWGLIISPKQ